MADIPVTQDELALRRRARRRLVGAIAIALTAVVVLPMLFDPEPKPLGPEVDIRIPAQDTPFETGSSLQSPASPIPLEAPAQQEAEPTQPTAMQPATTPDRDAEMAAEMADKAARPKPAEVKQASPKPAPIVSPIPAKPDQPADKVVKQDESASDQGYYLQLGAFGSEANAKKLQAKAQTFGFKSGLSNSNGQVRVRIGPVPDHDKALDYQAQLKAKGLDPVLVGP